MSVPEPHFLTPAHVNRAHAANLAAHGGLDGVRDPGGLSSAIMAPRNVFYYEGGDLFDIAAAYAYHIAEAQAYIDGNKRAAIACAIVFLRGNGIPATCPDSMDLYPHMIAVASGELDRPGLAAELRKMFDR